MAISGRELGDVRDLLGLEQLVYVGNHGAQRWPDVAGPRPKAQGPRSNAQGTDPAGETAQLLRLALEAFARALPLEGLLLEHKGATASIHYRRCADSKAARLAVLDALARLPELGDIQVAEGRLVVNLLPPGSPNKGSAVSALIEEYGLRGVIYLGDDGTDLDAFTALRRLRESSYCRTLSIAVLNSEAPLPVERAADLTLANVQEVEWLLRALASN